MGLRAKFHKRFGPQAFLRRLVRKRSGMRVFAGPFAGMRYIDQSYGSAYMPKLVGIYEREIYEVIEQVIASNHDLLVDVGAAEGYFAVGLAKRCQANVIAFEMSDQARRLAKQLATVNDVADSIEMHGKCSLEMLDRTLAAAARPFVLIDVEGAEAELLDPQRAPSLEQASILAELHETARPGITAELFRRFESTHTIRLIWQTERSADDFPYQSFWTKLMPQRYLRRSMEEQRGANQSWMWMVPHAVQSQQAA